MIFDDFSWFFTIFDDFLMGAILKKMAISFKENALRVADFLKSSLSIWKSIIGRFWNREWAKKSQIRVYMIKIFRCAGLTVKRPYKKKAYIY